MQSREGYVGGSEESLDCSNSRTKHRQQGNTVREMETIHR